MKKRPTVFPAQAGSGRLCIWVEPKEALLVQEAQGHQSLTTTQHMVDSQRDCEQATTLARLLAESQMWRQSNG